MLETGEAAIPWPWADFWPVARLHIKKSGEELYVLSSASGASLAFGPGHVNGSALPATEGPCVIAAHRDTHFGFLKDIKIGDEFIVQRVDGQSRSYRASGIQIVDIRQTKMKLDMEQAALILVTCYPFDSVLPGGPQRLLVQLLPAGEFDAG